MPKKTFAQAAWLAASKSAHIDTFGRIATPILPRLFLSDYSTADDEQELARIRITHAVSVLEYPPPAIEKRSLKTLHIPIADRPEVDILVHLDRTTDFIRQALSCDGTNVLVHCFKGVSRSATVVCAYLVATTDMSARDALAFVKERRSIVSPNIGFLRQLETYSIHCGKKADVTHRMVALMDGISQIGSSCRR